LYARDTENYNGLPVVAQQAILQIDLSRFGGQLPAVLAQLTTTCNADDLRPLNRNIGLYVLHSRVNNVLGLMNILQATPAITLAEPDYIVKTVGIPNDPNFASQWDMLNTTTPGADIAATQAWNVSTGSTANVIGVVDTGVDYTHPDLAANVWSAPAQFTVTLSFGQLTCPAGSHGYNAVTRSCNPADDNEHGTHVSGTIGAVGNNGLGVAGVNWTTSIMALKFLDSTGSGSTSDAIDAIEFGLQTKTIFGAAANLRVLSNSWGGSGASQALLNEINKANTADVLFVVAAGNTATNDGTTPTYPASFNTANMISVAATTNTDGLASFSNFGNTTVHLGAPGVNILSTLPNAAYGFLSGTSMATPHVSGAAMLVLSKCALNTAGLKNALLSNVDVLPSLQGLTITGGRLNVNKAIRSCASVGPPTGAAAFVTADTSTSGSWKGVYGAEGYNIINASTAYPTYVSPTPSANFNITWVQSTGDPRATQKPNPATDRIAASWYSSTSFTVDFPFADGNTHQVALYLLDWDAYLGGRSERIDILDANGTVLDSRSVASFVNGTYMVWNLSGHVVARITNTGASNNNAVLSAILFGGAGSTSTATGTASFVTTDTATEGSWKTVYGSQGYNVINDSASYPSYVTVTASGNIGATWASSTSDPRATQKASAADRIAACWFSSTSFTIDLAFNDTNTHQVALYLLDWDAYLGGRSERIDTLDGNGSLLDTRSVAGFSTGQYLVWNLSGHVVLRITNTGAPTNNAVMSGLFFGGASAGAAAAFVRSDTATSGTWKGVYGVDGYAVVGDSATYPGYVAVTAAGNATAVWSSSTGDTRALQKASASDRIAATWFSSTSFTIDLAFNDTNTHQIALYLLDWDTYLGGRSERIDILDTNGNVLDTRSASSFTNGQYLVWNVAGHVVVRLSNTGAPTNNAVVSGLFFR
jgi:subtilisin family serine protease